MLQSCASSEHSNSSKFSEFSKSPKPAKSSKAAVTALAVGIAVTGCSWLLALEAQAEQPNRSLASVSPSPAAVSQKTSTNPQKVSSANHYSKAVLQAKARAAYPKTHLEKGFYLKQKKDLNNALVEFLKATQENPHLVKGFYEQALIFRERGYRKLAESALEQALSYKPDYTDARVLLATVRLEQGNFGGAVQELSRSLGLTAPESTVDKDNNNNNNETASNKSSTDSPSTSSSARDTGLLSMALPAILQSMHGILGTPAPPIASNTSSGADNATSQTDTSKAAADLEEGKTNLANMIAGTGEEHKDKKARGRKQKTAQTAATHSAPTDPQTPAEVIAETPKPKKTRIKKSNSLLSYFKRTIEPAQEKIETANLENSKPEVSSKESDLPTQMSVKPEDQVKMPWESGTSETAKIASKVESASDKTFWLEPAKTAAVARERAEEQEHLASGVPENPVAPETDKPQNSIFGSATTFNAPSRPVSSTGILGSLFSSAPTPTEALDADGKPIPPPKLVKLDTDEWAKKLKYYVDNGSNSLKNGEAFMFSEDTGEASLFLADGTTIRRIVAQPVDAKDVMRQRRPDIANAEDMLYGLSLLGKLIPKLDTQQPATVYEPASQQQPGGFRGDNLMSGSQSFWGWLKSVCKL